MLCSLHLSFLSFSFFFFLQVLDFPLGGEGPFLCSQGFGGQFTHFYPSTFHAVDLECAVGTPVLAVADGVVVEVHQDAEVTGVRWPVLWIILF